MFHVGDIVVYSNGGYNPLPAVVTEVGEGACPYHLNVPYRHHETGALMNFSVWVPTSSVSPMLDVPMPTIDELKRCHDFYKKTYEETPEEAYDRAMGVI